MAWCGWKAWYPILSQGGLQLPWAAVLTTSLGSSCPCQSSCSSVLTSVELNRHPIKVNSRAPASPSWVDAAPGRHLLLSWRRLWAWTATLWLALRPGLPPPQDRDFVL